MLEQPLREMLVAMRFDIERERALADHAELHRNYEREVSSYLFTIAYFCAVPVTPASIPGSEAAKGAKIAHILRDFIVDCADGQFNISRQEIAAYRLDLKSINTQITGLAGRRWVAVKVRIAEQQLSSGLQDVSQVGGARYRIIVAILVAKYQTYLCQCRIDQFALQPQLAFRWGRFARKLLTNIGVVFLTPAKPVRRPPDAESIRNLVPHPRVEQVLLALRLHPIRNRSIASLLRDLCPASRFPRRRC